MSWKRTKFIAVGLDPLHIGTGGERLGRVDLSVVREPNTKIPKIPGTTLSGALKFFLDLKLRDEKVKSDICASTRGSRHRHDWQKCPVCCSFGYTPQGGENDQEPQASAQGTLQFSDGLLFACPVSSARGPVWLTTMPRLFSFLELGDGADDGGENYVLPAGSGIVPLLADGRINLGAAVLGRADKICPAVDDMVAAGVEKRFAERLVVVSEWLFAHLVNDNMEVRTSVVIDPETGAASSQGLFTYEAVVRGALWGFEIIEHDYRHLWPETAWPEAPERFSSAVAMLEAYAFPGVAQVGLGGMTTRGFGRLGIKRLS